MGLKWDQVNFEQGIISILESKNHERRDIPMNEMVMKALQGVERKGEYVFCSESGRPFVTLQSSFHAAVSKSGINDFRFHDLRHTFASNLVMEGVDIMTVKELLGTRT